LKPELVMANTGNILSTALSGLRASQTNLATTGHNITNVNTEGYSRQAVDLATRTPSSSGAGFIGTGVSVTSIQRVYDDFTADQVTSRLSSYNQAETLRKMASQIDTTLADADVGLNPALQEFFNSVQGVASSPTSMPARDTLISDANILTNKFQNINNRLESQRTSINEQLEVMTKEVTDIAASIASMNNDIVYAQGQSGGNPPNDLLDQRDVLINKLAELVSVRTVDNPDGSLNVFIGNGQTLVLGSTASELSTVRNEYDLSELEVGISNGGSTINVSNQITGGKLGGLLSYRDQVIDVTQDNLGRISMALADQFNTQHQSGDDLNGVAGGLFFDDVVGNSPEVLASVNNNPATGVFNVYITDTNEIEASDYNLSYDGTNFSLRRLSDDTLVDTFNIGNLPRTVAGEGIQLVLSGAISAGDSFLVRPVRNTAGDMGVNLSDGADVAAAATGNPSGDNSNALALAALQDSKGMGNSTQTFQSAYAGLVSTVGVTSREAQVNSSAQKGLLDKAEAAQAEISGVNLDEEAANMLRFQQAYQAAAQLIRISDEVFQTLLGVAGR
jgi:flagellar hook-associated protein 1 FlgK